MTETTISRYYADDHDRLDELFRQYQSLKAVEWGQARNRFQDFKRGLERHIAWEEDLLFPLFEAKTGMRDVGPIIVMRHEHQQIKYFLNLIDIELQEREQAPEPEEAGLLEVLEVHNWKEEHILYPAIDQCVTPEERRQVFDRMGVTVQDSTRSGL